MSDMVFQTSQQDHLSQDQKERNTPRWNNKAERPSLTRDVNPSDEQGQSNQTVPNHIKYQKGITVHYHLFAEADILESWQSKAKF